MPRPSDYLPQRIVFLIFSRFFTFPDSDLGILSQDPDSFYFFDFFEVFAASWVSCPLPLSIRSWKLWFVSICLPVYAMPPAAEDMTIDDLKAACEALVCRILPSPFVSSPGPEGIFNHVNFPTRSLNEVDCAPSVQWVDLLTQHTMTVPFEEQGRAYKQAITHNDHNDLQRMPAPYGSRVALPLDTRLQLVVREEQNGKCTIFKHFIFPQKCKKAFFQTVTFGESFKPTCAHAHAAGKKIMQYCLENMGARQYRCNQLTNQAIGSSSRTGGLVRVSL